MRLQDCRPEKPVIVPSLAVVHCPRCGDRMVAPESSEFVDRGEIRHHWVCDACGQDFETSVILCWN